MTAFKPLCVLSSLTARPIRNSASKLAGNPAGNSAANSTATLIGNLTGNLIGNLTGKLAVCLLSLSSLGALIAQPALANRMYVSWYGPGFDGGYTANGEVFSRYEYTAAHPEWPFGTLVQLTNPNTGAVVTVRVNDRSGGALDISEQAARDLGTYHTGIAPVEVDIIQWGE